MLAPVKCLLRSVVSQSCYCPWVCARTVRSLQNSGSQLSVLLAVWMCVSPMVAQGSGCSALAMDCVCASARDMDVLVGVCHGVWFRWFSRVLSAWFARKWIAASGGSNGACRVAGRLQLASRVRRTLMVLGRSCCVRLKRCGVPMVV